MLGLNILLKKSFRYIGQETLVQSLRFEVSESEPLYMSEHFYEGIWMHRVYLESAMIWGLLITLWVQMHIERIYVRSACLFTGLAQQIMEGSQIACFKLEQPYFPRFIMHKLLFFFTGKVLPGVAALSDAKKD